MLLAATDPGGDVTACPPRGAAAGADAGGDPRIDILGARGEIIERGTALRFTIRFGEAFEAPDAEGTPLRVDILLRDPDVPTVSFRYYRGLNRIVRFDAVPDPALQIVLLPEEGANVSLGAVALGDTVTMTLPGRLVTRDADLEGLGLERMRWSVIARDENDCDALGDGRPTERLLAEPSPSASVGAMDRTPPAPAGREPASDAGDGSSTSAPWLLVAGGMALALFAVLGPWRARRR